MSEIDDLIELLNSEDSVARREAVTGLGRCNDKKAIKQLVGLLRDEDPVIKDEAVNAITGLGGREVVTAVLPLLYDDEVYVCNIACEILGRLGDAALVSMISLLDEDDDDVLKFAIDVIGAIRNPLPVSDLIPLIMHENANIRASVAVTLGMLKATEAIDALIDLIHDDEEWVKFSALEAIGEIGGKNITDQLLEVYEGEGITRIAALDALSQLADGEDAVKVVPVISDPEITDLLSIGTIVNFAQRFKHDLDSSQKKIFIDILIPRLKALDEVDVDLERDILRGLADLNDKRAIDVLIEFAGTRGYEEETREILKEAIVNSKDVDKIAAALKIFSSRALVFVEALAEIADPTTVKALSDLLTDCDDSKVRNVIVEALAAIGGPETYDSLINSLTDSEGTVRRNAATGLGILGDGRAAEPLLDALVKEEYEDVKDAIGEAIASFKGEEVEESFDKLLSHADNSVRIAGVKGLGNMSSESSKATLTSLLTDSDSFIRSEALRSLSVHAGEEILSTVSGALTDDDKDVRLTALDMLVNMPGAESGIVKALDDEDMWVRFKAAGIIADKEIASAENRLIELLRSDVVPVKVASAKALGRIKSHKAIELLKEFAEDDDPNLKDAAVEALLLCEGQ
ncbi:MAG: HEAT repeat domain-containing protein, partial [Thermodesulfobacteriota bacterium]